ncbi:hypothetical protein UUU_00850 [Klebsiella pneumoniae subsp. pneumoniae DSM 30104 = JCM 1662 = NBRC 14940]|nr:hypothetical protein UUU_00850 [Klebsiella pneumoniae subsp. pneumoniae DSM 30104 = JCM 1662 = NBRC 14940]
MRLHQPPRARTERYCCSDLYSQPLLQRYFSYHQKPDAYRQRPRWPARRKKTAINRSQKKDISYV